MARMDDITLDTAHGPVVLTDRLCRQGPEALLTRAAAAGAHGVEPMILAVDDPRQGLFYDAGPAEVRAWRARAGSVGLRFISGCIEITSTGAADVHATVLLARKALYLVRDLGGDLLRIVFTAPAGDGACPPSANWIHRVVSAVGRIAAWDAGNDEPPFRTVCVSFAFAPRETRRRIATADLPAFLRNASHVFRGVNLALGYGPIVADAADLDDVARVAALVNGGEFVLQGPELTAQLDDTQVDRAQTLLGAVYGGPLLIAPASDTDEPALSRICARLASRTAPHRDYDPLKLSYASSVARRFRPLGSARLETPADVEAGTLSTWRYVFRVAEPGIAAGGGLKITLNRASGLNGLQTRDPARPDYISVHGPESIALESRVVREDACTVLQVQVTRGQLMPGDDVHVTFGDRTGGSPGVQAQTDREEHARFFTRVDPSGQGLYFEVRDVPSLRVTSAAPERLRIASPQTVRAGEPFTVRIGVDDRWRNPARGLRGSLCLAVNGRPWPDQPAADPDEPAVFRVDGVRLTSPGLHELSVAGIDNGLNAVRLTVECRAAHNRRPTLFWGDIHGHTGLMDGLGTPDQYFTYGRDIGFLDFCSYAEHMDGLFDGRQASTPEQWRLIVEKTRHYHAPGRFVTLLGYECSQDWDANVYFPGDDAPWFVTAFPSRLFQFARRHGALVVPHMTTYPQRGRGYDWGYYDPSVLPVMEIYSCHGASERFGGRYPLRGCEPGGYAQEALALGHRIGFIGSGDSHCGKPGNARLQDYSSGMVAVYAAELSRDAIFDALRRRCCYATTGARILAWFDVAGCFMGGETALPAGQARVVRGAVFGTAPLERVDVVSDGEDLYTLRPDSTRCEFEYADNRPLRAATYYYVRITQTDGAMAWLSPVWVSRAPPHANLVGR